MAKGGLEPPRLSSLPPQGSASTNSATWALARFRHTGTQPRNCTSGSTVLVAVFGIRSCGFGIGGGNLAGSRRRVGGRDLGGRRRDHRDLAGRHVRRRNLTHRNLLGHGTDVVLG